MELVRSRAGDDVDDTAGGTSSLSSVAVGLDGDLLNAFDVRLDTDGADDAFVVVDTIDDPVVEGFVLSVDGEAGCVGTAIIGAATAARVRCPGLRWRREREQRAERSYGR